MADSEPRTDTPAHGCVDLAAQLAEQDAALAAARKGKTETPAAPAADKE